jgi:hypothetical protein
MQPYLVHIERDNVRGWDVIVQPEGQPGRHIRMYNAAAVKVEGVLAEDQHENMETWYAPNLDSAEAMAGELAKKKPGRTILVLELKSIAQTAATPPVISKYTPKGVLPR